MSNELFAASARCDDDPLSALLLASEVECALEDLGHERAFAARTLTDTFAEAWLGLRHVGPPLARELVARLGLPDELTLELRRPEGYAFYALDPLSYAKAAVRLADAREVCVVGVRSIGTSLSAVARAALVRAGLVAQRITVRPSGHPWSRVLELGEAERSAVERVATTSDFMVVDEGPGISGSTLLAVAEALERRGVPASRIRLLASRPIVAERLCAEDAPHRFARFTRDAVAGWSAPPGTIDVSGGRWRRHVELQAWPACWTLHERAKYLEPDRGRIHKFSGLSRYGAEVFDRARLLADAGFSPPVEASQAGFLAYAWLPRRPARSAADASRAVDALARYLAFRAREFAGPEPRPGELEAMTKLNCLEGTGESLPDRFELELVKPVIADGRMLPHEWLVDAGDSFVKTDAAEHGDDHFYPGPVDSAWDIAGAIVEWNLGPRLEDTFVTRYAALAHDDVRSRLEPYKLAYCALRLGMASFAASDSDDDERSRWQAARRQYAARLGHTLARLAARG